MTHRSLHILQTVYLHAFSIFKMFYKFNLFCILFLLDVIPIALYDGTLVWLQLQRNECSLTLNFQRAPFFINTVFSLFIA